MCCLTSLQRTLWNQKVRGRTQGFWEQVSHTWAGRKEKYVVQTANKESTVKMIK